MFYINIYIDYFYFKFIIEDVLNILFPCLESEKSVTLNRMNDENNKNENEKGKDKDKDRKMGVKG